MSRGEDRARRGVVLVTSDASAGAFFDELLHDYAPAEGRALRLRPGLACIAAVGGTHRRRLLVIDGDSSDVPASSLIEAVRVVDDGLPIVLISHRGGDRPPGGGVVVLRGPLVSLSTERLISELLGEQPI
jgi:hypothetical protein